MLEYNTAGYIEDIFVTEKEKNKEEYLRASMDRWVALLMQEKTHVKKYRDYYSGIRDNDDFAYITENFGIGNPVDLQFTNLIKPRIDSLVGRFLTENITYRVTCTDDKSIDLGMQERKQKYLHEVKASVESFVKSVANSVAKEQEGAQPTQLMGVLKQVQRKYLSNYTSDLEIAAQDLLSYFSKSSDMNLKDKLETLVTDLLITGECYYRVYYTHAGSDPILEVIKTENIFYTKNTNFKSIHEAECDAVVHREYMSRKQVLRKYGKFMDSKQLETLFGDETQAATFNYHNPGEFNNHTTYNPYPSQIIGNASDAVAVLHIEWIGLNEIDIEDDENYELLQKGHYTEINGKCYRADRYEGTRIGEIYVNCGKVEDVPRTMNDPHNVKLSYNGVTYNSRTGEPYSLVGALVDIQDMYDIVGYYRAAMFASAGTKGSRINTAAIPTELGTDFMDRLMKFITIKKQGIELINPALEGAAQFQHYGEYDESLSQQAIAAWDAVLNSIALQADLACGVNQDVLGQIAQRDAVTNVQQGIKQSLLMNEALFELVRNNQKYIMLDLLDTSKLTYRTGKKIRYIAGSESYVFNIMPEMMSFSDFAIEPSYSSKDELKLQTLQQLIKEFASGQMIDPDVLIKVVLSDSITEVKELVEDSMAEKKKENDQLQQAQQQLQQMEKQLNELKNQNNQLQQKLDQVNEAEQKRQDAKQKADEQNAKEKLELEKQKADDLANYQKEQIRLKEKLLQAELVEAKTGTGNEKEIKNV